MINKPSCGHTPTLDPTAEYVAGDCKACWFWVRKSPEQQAEESRLREAIKPSTKRAASRFQTVPGCAHRGLPTGERRPCNTCTGKVEIPLLSCTVHGQCSTTKAVTLEDGTPVKNCRLCTDRPQPTSVTSNLNEVVLSCSAAGGGDMLDAACVSASYKEAHPEQYVVLRGGERDKRDPLEWVGLFAGVADELRYYKAIVDPPKSPGEMNYGYGREDIFNKRIPTRHSTIWDLPRWKRYGQNIGFDGFKIPELKEPERIRRIGKDCEGAVGIAVNSTDVRRSWSIQHALTLEKLLHDSGYKTVIFHHDANAIKDFRGLKLANVRAERLAGALLNCAAVVATDNGIAHFAGILKRPFIVLDSWLPGRQIYGCYPGYVEMKGELACGPCCNGGPMDLASTACAPTCANLDSIAPKRVLDAVDEVVLTGITGGRSLVDWKRLRVIRDAVRSTNHLSGVHAELGVYKGGVAALILREMDPNSELLLYDTFAGIPETDDHGEHKRGDFNDTNAQEVWDWLNPQRHGKTVRLRVGEFPQTGQDFANSKYRFAHIDGDTYQTTVAAMDFFIPRMVKGGVLVFDDYGWWKCPGVMRALHEVLPPERIIQTPGCTQAQVRF